MSTENSALVRIETPYYVAGVIVDKVDKIVYAAPILRWALGKSLGELKAWCLKKEFKCVEYSNVYRK